MATGRPSKLTPEIVGPLLADLRRGHFIATAVAASEIGSDTFYVWLRRGRDPKGEPEYRQFAVEVERALAEGERSIVEVIYEAAHRGDQGAAKWLAERRWPLRYAAGAKRRDPLEDARELPTAPAEPAPAAEVVVEEQEAVEVSVMDELSKRRANRGRH